MVGWRRCTSDFRDTAATCPSRGGSCVCSACSGNIRLGAAAALLGAPASGMDVIVHVGTPCTMAVGVTADSDCVGDR